MLVSDQVLTRILIIPASTTKRAKLESVLKDTILINAEDGLLDAVNNHQPDIVLVSALTPKDQADLSRLRQANDRPFLVRLDLTFAPPDDLFDITLPTELLNTELILHLRSQQQQIDKADETLMTQEQNRRNIEILKSAIVSNVSHELRTPLLQVKSAVSLLAEDVDNSTLVEYATNATARLEAVVNNITQLLAFSQDSRECTPVLMRECVQAALRNLGRSWEHKQTNAIKRIQTNIEPDLPPVWGDRQGISTVLQLLLDNALKFSEAHVELTIKRKRDRVYVTVRDFGIGIAPDKIQDIFDTFYQIDSSTTRPYSGAGVGLAIVRLIMEHHNTTIQVKSKEGQGSTFSFNLPVARLDQ